MDDMHIVTEIGVFGELDIKDPTEKKIKKKKEKEDINELIKDAIQENLNIDM